ncbi:hypothetical protein JK628_02755 [Shewanella sp. KX20019]|uniref:hypothetical protein n=1 Tax=Shewanella sp. KX20019 TaxID=2803864 RepID=UPI00192875A2|nr:hypothetical protein [Shewanella sp. KX20019]QQX80809.1 hypothetical protein JK628_02755 [Shewanella sp. KX20019]
MTCFKQTLMVLMLASSLSACGVDSKDEPIKEAEEIQPVKETQPPVDETITVAPVKPIVEELLPYEPETITKPEGPTSIKPGSQTPGPVDETITVEPVKPIIVEPYKPGTATIPTGPTLIKPFTANDIFSSGNYTAEYEITNKTGSDKVIASVKSNDFSKTFTINVSGLDISEITIGSNGSIMSIDGRNIFSYDLVAMADYLNVNETNVGEYVYCQLDSSCPTEELRSTITVKQTIIESDVSVDVFYEDEEFGFKKTEGFGNHGKLEINKKTPHGTRNIEVDYIFSKDAIFTFNMVVTTKENGKDQFIGKYEAPFVPIFTNFK